jgi:hypothetical protein
MHRLLLALIIFVVSILGIVVLFSPSIPKYHVVNLPSLHSSDSQEHLVVLNSPLDLGNVPQGVVTGEFRLVNHSKNSLRLVRCEMSCYCTKMEHGNRKIAADETFVLPFEWDTTGDHGVSGGEFTIFYNEKDSDDLKSLKLIVKADILPKFIIEPDSLTFSARQNETKSIKLIPRYHNIDVRIESITSNSDAFNVSKRSDYEAAITFISEKYDNTTNDVPRLTLTTNEEKDRHRVIFIDVIE